MRKKTLIYDATIIADNISNLNSGRSGIFFVAYNVLKQLVKTEQFDVSVFCDNRYNKDFIDFAEKNFGKNIKIYSGNRFDGILKKLSDLNSKLRAHHLNISKLLLNIFVRKPIGFLGRFYKLPKFDIAVSPVFVLPDIIRANKKYIILHDAIPLLFPQYYKTCNADKNFWYNILVKYIKTQPKCKFFAVSESTKKDFIKLLNVNPDDINVMPLAASDNFYHENDEKQIKKICKKYKIPSGKKYVFSLCTLEPRKNLIRSIKTFIQFIDKNKINDMIFVLGGAHWDEFIGKLESEIKDLGKYKDKIVRVGYVDDKDLAALYSGAQWFVYTSQYEGFGLPPLEAMKCGAPVITSNNSSLPEVVGNAAIVLDWDSDEQHIAAYEKYYFDEKYRKSMAQKGLEHSKQFSWEKTVNIMIDIIKKGF